MSTRLHLIYAKASNGVIGHQGTIPWYLPEDLAHFKRCTLGCPVIMGRKTWDSLLAKFRPLPERLNIVITHDTTLKLKGALVAHSLKEAMELFYLDQDAWIIGGGQIYQQAIPLSSSVVVTEIDHEYAGDTFAPELTQAWHEVKRAEHVSTKGIRFAFVTYSRVSWF